MKFKAYITLVLLIILSSASVLYPQEKEEAEEKFFTYAGFAASAGFNWIDYSGWSGDSIRNKDYYGTGYSGGVMLDVFARDIVGELNLQYAYNTGSAGESKVRHLYCSASVKYVYPINAIAGAAAGLGLYIEGPPSDKKYDGGGVLLPLGAIFTISRDWKIVTDINIKYGRYGIGESYKLSCGMNIGIVYKVGNI
jgi:hypothetical protein